MASDIIAIELLETVGTIGIGSINWLIPEIWTEVWFFEEWIK
jgi:hypothetical protein